jgi:hypothetical protein
MKTVFAGRLTLNIGLLIFAFSQLAYSQSTSPVRTSTIRPIENPNAAIRPSPEATELVLDGVMVKPATEIRKETREKIHLSGDEKDSYKKSSGDKKANVVRMLTAFSCSSAMVIDVSDPRCAENPDLATVSYYSFRVKDYGKGPFTDINLVEDELDAGNKWQTVGMIADVGDAADFAKLDEGSADVDAIWNLPTATTFKEMTKQRADIEGGFSAGKLTVTNKLKFQTGHTYLLRTIAYRTGDYSTFSSDFSWYNTDSMFVFKIADIDDKRAVTIIWKKVYQRVAPLLQTKEKEKQQDAK